MPASNPISLMTFPFANPGGFEPARVEHLLSGVKAIGFSGVEVFLSHLIGTPGSMGLYRDLLARLDLHLACVDVICDLVSTDAETRASATEQIRIGIETAQAFDCQRVMLAGSTLKLGVSPQLGRRMMAESIASQVSLARRAGITLMIEDFGMAPDLCCRARDCLDLVAQTGGPPTVQFTFDTGNFLFAEEKAEDQLEAFHGCLHHVHLKAWRNLDERQPGDSGVYSRMIGCPINEGKVPNEVLVKRILAKGYAGWFSLECSASGTDLAAARRDYEAVAGWLADSGK